MRVWVALLAAAVGSTVGCGGSDSGPWPPSLPRLETEVAQRQLERLAEATRLDPSSSGPLIPLCLALEANRQWTAADECFARLSALDPELPHARLHGYFVREKLRGGGEPGEVLDRLVREHPDFAPGFDRHGELALLNGDLERAASDFRRLVELAPGSPVGYFGLARVSLERRDFASARRAAEDGLRLDPVAGQGYFLLGRALRGLGEFDEAAVALERGALASREFLDDTWSDRLAEYAWTPGAALEQARAARARGDLSVAARLAQRAVDGAPQDIAAQQLLAVVQLDQGDSEASCATLEEARTLQSDNLETLLQLANCSLAGRHAQTALTYAEKALALGPGVARAHQLMGRALLACCPDRLEEARRSFESALRLAPADPQVRRDLGHCCLQAGDLTCAEEQFRGLIRNRPWEVWGYLGLAQTAGIAGDFEEAARALEDATRLDARHPAVLDLRRRVGLDP
ncbi:MAG: tetratricopeptide repeat protein [Thermoanaerobaculia bacterium]|nr:tetratricopeptide repeat protein [Thermoanaerobaculia bacterium]